MWVLPAGPRSHWLFQVGAGLHFPCVEQFPIIAQTESPEIKKLLKRQLRERQEQHVTHPNSFVIYSKRFHQAQRCLVRRSPSGKSQALPLNPGRGIFATQATPLRDSPSCPVSFCPRRGRGRHSVSQLALQTEPYLCQGLLRNPTLQKLQFRPGMPQFKIIC